MQTNPHAIPDPDAVTPEESQANNIGVINPYALAELKLGKRMNWTELADSHEVMASTLETRYEDLFDPGNNMTLYAGMRFDDKTGDLESFEGDNRVTDDSPVVRETVNATQWLDVGSFYSDCAEFSDPIQGAVGDCYLIAALSAVAWARTYVIAHRTWRDQSQREIDMVLFNQNNDWIKIAVSEKLPLRTPGNSFIYARSQDRGELWPAIYEKAYAKWKTNDNSDTPNILAIAGGDMVRATDELMGGTRYYYATRSLTADSLWTKVRQNSISRKTFNPMTAWTYSSGQSSPDHVNYNSANIVANHAYTVLGWDYRNAQKYIILRNPWGQTESRVGVDNGHWAAWDAPYYGGPGKWISVNLPLNDGVFALRMDEFKKYFAGLGLVK